jgi:hypothetical protein
MGNHDWREVTFNLPVVLDEAITKAARGHLMAEAEYVRAALIEAVQEDGVKILPSANTKGRRAR